MNNAKTTTSFTNQDFTDILIKVGFVKGFGLREYHLYLFSYELLKKLGVGIDECRQYLDYIYDEKGTMILGTDNAS